MRLVCLLFSAFAAAHPGTYTVTNDIEYTRPAGVSVKLDAHVPPGKGPFPTVILVHGGGWTAGDKEGKIIQPLFEPLTDGGFTWFSINYRLAPDYPYPAAADDVEAAVRFVKARAREYKVDPARIALMGESAGGHLVNLIGARNRVGVAAVVCFYGPIDMVEWAKRFEGKPLPQSAKAFFGIDSLDAAGLAKLREASPATYLNSKTPPFLVIHGTKDEAVDYSQALLTVKLFKKIGVPCKLIKVQDGVHGVMNWEKEARFQGYKPEMLAWLHQTLGLPF
ncbi:MAG: alpha/beta hydrolase [Acidobacteriota bacterium]|nr:alpha/beta hydrolase [Acidobacteriota bacterium]